VYPSSCSCSSCQCGEAMSLNCGHQQVYCFIPQVIYKYGEPWWNGIERNTEELGGKPVSMPLCLPQIPRGLTWMQTRASMVRGRQPTAWAMVWPFYILHSYSAEITVYLKCILIFTIVDSNDSTAYTPISSGTYPPYAKSLHPSRTFWKVLPSLLTAV
jgi:hypothetical protein